MPAANPTSAAGVPIAHLHIKSKVVHFNGIGLCFFEHVGFRHPAEGEFYLFAFGDGFPHALRATGRTSFAARHIVKPTFYAKAETRIEYVPGAWVRL